MPQKDKGLTPKHEGLSSFSATKKSSLQQSTPATSTEACKTEAEACLLLAKPMGSMFNETVSQRLKWKQLGKKN